MFALFRWQGWLDPLPLDRPEAAAAARVAPRCARRPPGLPGLGPRRSAATRRALVALGGAPNWTARAEGWKRLHEGIGVTADPWRLFPLAPRAPAAAAGRGLAEGEVPRVAQCLAGAGSPLWVRAQGDDREASGTSCERGLKPWVHRKVEHAAKLAAEANVHHLPTPSSTAASRSRTSPRRPSALACDPDPGERWWDACAGAGGKALHLAALMRGKGLVVATDVNESKLKETVRRARRSPFRNVTTKPWDGKRVAGKAGSFDGVLVDAPCSAIGTWRRNPDARWTLDREAIGRLAELQAQILRAAAAGVKTRRDPGLLGLHAHPGRDHGVIRPFLATHPEFQLDPFPHPLTGTPTDGTAPDLAAGGRHRRHVHRPDGEALGRGDGPTQSRVIDQDGPMVDPTIHGFGTARPSTGRPAGVRGRRAQGRTRRGLVTGVGVLSFELDRSRAAWSLWTESSQPWGLPE